MYRFYSHKRYLKNVVTLLLGRSLVRTTKDKVLKGNTFGRITFTLDY